ncbi:MAG: hypothetical protein AAFR67_03265, partial [Chloroflexota bacterium]
AESAAFGETGFGWVTNAGVGNASLMWEQPIDLTSASAPQLRFVSLITADNSTPSIEISVAGGAWTPLAIPFTANSMWMPHTFELSAYTGNVVQLRFVWNSPAASSDIWLLDNVSVVDLGAILVSATPSPTPTAITITETLAPEITPEVTVEVTDAVTPEITQEATALLPSLTPTATVVLPIATASQTATLIPSATATLTASPTLILTSTPSPTLTATPTSTPESP